MRKGRMEWVVIERICIALMVNGKLYLSRACLERLYDHNGTLRNISWKISYLPWRTYFKWFKELLRSSLRILLVGEAGPWTFWKKFIEQISKDPTAQPGCIIISVAVHRKVESLWKLEFVISRVAISKKVKLPFAQNYRTYHHNFYGM